MVEIHDVITNHIVHLEIPEMIEVQEMIVEMNLLL